MLSQSEEALLTTHLKSLLDTCSVIDAAVVATMDGHLCATEQRTAYSMDRLATMGSSLMSLGDTITAELKMGTCKNLIAENQSGIVAFMHVNENLVLISLTTAQTGLGMLLSHSKKSAAKMAEALPKA